MSRTQKQFNAVELVQQIRIWGKELGFQQIGISGIELHQAEQQLLQRLDAGYYGEMDYMARHGTKRSRPAELEPGTLSVICARMNYLPDCADAWSVLHDSQLAYISRYALGRDYHKLLRKRLQQLADRINTAISDFHYRVFVDSAPVLEKPLAQQAGLGWIGKHSNLLDRKHGSWFFLGEIYTNLPLPTDTPVAAHCGSCQACIDICPTSAIIKPAVLDARRCISYLTIEHPGSIPIELRPLLGNRIYGCDDCQLICPWNRFAHFTTEANFMPRYGFDAPTLIELFSWDEKTFLRKTEGSTIRRIGHERWLRNCAIALGNAPYNEKITSVLQSRAADDSVIVREHVEWALKRNINQNNQGNRKPLQK